MLLRTLPVAAFLLITFNFSVRSQTCSPPAIVANAKSDNIFTAEQEMYLGEAMLEQVRMNYGVIDDEAITAHLQKIGDRLIRHMPNTGIKFRFMIADVPDTNAYAFPGGIIMITRKMISFARNEDELAWVVAHELGHGTVRHGGIDWSRVFKKLLKVSTIGGREDVFEKYHRVIELENTKEVRTSAGHENDQQLEADRMGMFALVAAGYDAGQASQFWIRLTKAKKRSGFLEFFGASRPVDKRLGEMLGQYKTLPEACRENKGGSVSTGFENWRANVVAWSSVPKSETVPHVVSRRELTPLRSDIEHLKFSPNGEFILSQDSSMITVLKHDPLTVLFQIPADDSRPAEFSSDSSEIVTITNNLHVQKWSIAEMRLLSDHEVPVLSGYWQTRLSPNGDTLAAFHYSGDLVLYDVKSGDEIFRQKEFHIPYFSELMIWRLSRELSDEHEITIMLMKYSPDGKHFLAGTEFSRPFYGGHSTSIVINIPERKAIDVGGNIKKLVRTGFGFLSPDKVVGKIDDDIKNSGIFSFPSGERIEQFELGGMMFNRSASGDYLVVRPVVGAAVGVFDLQQKKYVFASKKSALDVSRDHVVAERKNGELAVYTIRNELISTVELPKSEFGELRTVSFSDDGKWLVASDKSRGAVWNVQTGERKFHLRTFRGSYIAGDGKIYADFPAVGDIQRSIATIDLSNGAVSAGTGFKEGNLRQHGRYVVIRRPLKQENEKEEKPGEQKLYTEEEADKWVDYKKTSLEVRDAQTGATLWIREFRNETPRYYLSRVHNTMCLVWRLKTQAANDIIKQRPELEEKAKMMKDDSGDYLIQILDAANGVAKGHFLLETGKGSFGVQDLTAAGDHLVVNDDENRQLVYSISTGALIRRFFGSRNIISPQNGLIAVENVSGRLTVYEVASGQQVGRFVMRKPISALTFSADGKRLFLLTRDQIAYNIDVTRMKPANSAN
ncbi:MAG: M48 family metalloprotease [Pyrinomonadaceae bacterium]